MSEEKQSEEKNATGGNETLPQGQGDDSKTSSKEVEVPAKFKEIVDNISEMSVIDLSELVKILEDKFGVSAVAPVAAVGVAAPVAGGEEAGDDDANATVNIELTDAGSTKIAVIKVVRGITEKGLKEAKDMVDGAPTIVKEGVAKEEAEEIKKKLEEAGGKVAFK